MLSAADGRVVLIAALGLGAIYAVVAGVDTGEPGASSEVGAIVPLAGWPVTTAGGSSFSPPILSDAFGRHVLIHGQLLPGSNIIVPRHPYVVARDQFANILPGWPPLTEGVVASEPAISTDESGRGVRIHVGSSATRLLQAAGRVIGFELDGSISPGWPQPPSDGDRFGLGVSLGDLDGDGIDEVLALSGMPRVYAWRRDGRLMPGWPRDLQLPSETPTTGGQGPPAVGDLDGDGRPELAVALNGGAIAVLDTFGRPKPGWPLDVSAEFSLAGPLVLVPMGDGTYGIAFTTQFVSPGGSRVYLLTHDGRVAPGWPRTGPGVFIRGVAAGDLDADGVPEIVFGDNQAVWAFHLDGELLRGWPIPFSFNRAHGLPIIADLDGDREADVLMLLSGGFDWFLRAWHANGTPLTRLTLSETGEETSDSPTLGDLNGDGLLDLALGVNDAFNVLNPGRIRVFSLGVPVAQDAFQWPTRGHDLQRTSAWTPPGQSFGGGGSVAPRRLRLDTSRTLSLTLDTPDGAPLGEPLSVTALAGFNIPAQLLEDAGEPAPGPPGRLQRRVEVDGASLLGEFLGLAASHPELLLTDPELQTWLDTGDIPAVPPGERRTLWLTVESARADGRQLKAHVPMPLCRATAQDGAEVFGVGGASCTNRPPVASWSVPHSTECTSAEGGWIVLDGSGSTDPDSSAGSSDDIVAYEWLENFGQPDERLIGTGRTLNAALQVGVHEVTLRVRDLFGEEAHEMRQVEVVDTQPPGLLVTLNPSLLWPPNGELVPVAASVSATDACGAPILALDSVSMVEGGETIVVAGGSDTDDVGDASWGTPDLNFLLRSERRGANGPDRVYRVAYSARDAGGNITRATAEVRVPHDLRR